MRLGDKGDGTPSSKEEARRRQAHLNEGHTSLTSTVPVRRMSSTSGSAAPRSRRRARSATARIAVCGGAASTADGHTFAFGNTLEALVAKVLGLKARGAPTDPHPI